MNRIVIPICLALAALAPFTPARAEGEKTVILEPMAYPERYTGSEKAEKPTGKAGKPDTGKSAQAAATTESMVPRLQREADAFLKALTEQDEAKVEGLLSEEFKKLLSEEKVSMKDYLAVREAGWAADLQKQEAVIQNTTLGMPQPPQPTNGLYVSFIPVTVVLVHRPSHPARMRLTGPTSITLTYHLVGISKDKGKSWKFFEAGESRSLTDRALGVAAENLVMPARFMTATPNE